MTQTESIFLTPVPKSIRVAGIPLAAFALTTFFILLGFPYHHLTDRAAAMASQALGVEITAADSGLSPGLDGPGFRFDDITVETPTGDIYPVDSMRFGPAWALSWFVADPTIFFEINSRLGHASGKVRTGDNAAWSGTASDVNLSDLAFLETLLPVKLTGTLNADADVHTVDGELAGPVGFAVRDGILTQPAMPVDLSFETIDGTIIFGGEAMLRIESFELAGPMLRLTATGEVGQGETLDERPLDLDLEFVDVTPQIRSVVETFGIRLGTDGSARLHIGGTLSKPVVN
ncbi:MAG: type II secretion system protein GspN [bacterium]|nr:type II secretion system protein GspN [bacterium]